MSRCTRWVDKGVIECKQWADRWTRRCQDWAAVGRQVCDEWADQGYNQCNHWEETWEKRCDDWDDRCCDWWPCSWGCKLITWVCVGWTWVSSWVCTAWVWVANWVCKAWYTVVEWVCVAWFWVLEATCTVWSWVAKLVCVAWDTARCAIVAVITGILVLARRRQRRIRHVFVIMLENRSFDHMLGVSAMRGRDAVSGQPTTIDNLVGNPHQNIDPLDGTAVQAGPPADFALSTADGDPGHEFHDAVEQLAVTGSAYPYSPIQQYPPIDMSGFVANYRGRGSTAPSKAMNVYLPDQLPILNALAREFAVCDRWFSSMPGPTWPNRLFVHASSSAGLDDSPSSFDVVTTTLLDGYRFDNGSIYDRLEDRCLDWLVFEGDETPQVMSLSGMTYNALQGRFRDFEDFRDSVNDRNFPASYTFIEPDYGNILPWTPEDYTCGTSQHPLDDVTRGEKLLKAVYEAVRNSPHWESSLIVVTYDEHGGFYDHVEPPRTVHPGDSITDNENNHNDFDFTQLGVRVPTVIVSPFIPRGTIDHTPYDHSSVVKTVGQLFGFGPLTERDRQANSFAHLLSLTEPRTDAPAQLPAAANSGIRCTGDDDIFASKVAADARGLMVGRGEDAPRPGSSEREAGDGRPVEPKLRGIMHVALLRQLSVAPISERDRILQRFLAIRTNVEAKRFIAEATDFVRAYKLVHPIDKPWLRGRRNVSPEQGAR
jgi:phospholipase C